MVIVESLFKEVWPGNAKAQPIVPQKSMSWSNEANQALQHLQL
jgi:hypothetical protein